VQTVCTHQYIADDIGVVDAAIILIFQFGVVIELEFIFL